jgi:hypothetical protein
MKNFLSDFGGKDPIMSWYASYGRDLVLKTNNHVHSPYSFSAFNSIEEMINMAKKEKIEVLGINDFFVTSGYDEFCQKATEKYIFPVFNIEFIGLLTEEQKNGIRVNDPNNPGRTYFSGKALRFPTRIPARYRLILEGLKIESQKQIVEMLDKLNAWLETIKSPFDIPYEEIEDKLARELIRERHIAKALRIKVNEYFTKKEEKVDFLKKLFDGKDPESNLNDHADFEGELRSVLLKSGGVAFVPEDPDTYLPLETLRTIIVQAGGIPTYPVLLDDKNGNVTDFEKDKNKLRERLESLGVYSVEFIPNRNTAKKLKEYSEYFSKHGFIVTYGTEHNSPVQMPLSISTRGHHELDNELQELSFRGVCVLAAHQYLLAQEEEGYINNHGLVKRDKINDFVNLGKAVIDKFLSC